jgi:hypothetical protein
MKTTITIENGKVSVQVDDGQPVQVETVKSASHVKSVVPPPVEVTNDKSINSKPMAADVPETSGRSCQFCDVDLSASGSRAKICKKPECKKAQGRIYAQRYAAKKGKKPATSEETIFLPGHEKTKKEVESWRPKVTLPEAVPAGRVVQRSPAGFEDPWNCQACRTKGELCPLHQSLTDKGKKPPRWS